MQDLDPEAEEAYIQALEEKRDLKQRGARANNKAATLDAWFRFSNIFPIEP